MHEIKQLSCRPCELVSGPMGPMFQFRFDAGKATRPKDELAKLSWLPVSFLLHVKYTLSYRIVK